MKSLLLSITIGLALTFSGGRAGLAAEYFVSPAGSASGDGSKAKPYSLASVLAGPKGQPGDTFWVMGGNYSLGYLSTKLQGAPGKPVAIRAVPGQRATVDGATTLWSSAGYVDFWGLEWMCSDTHRISTQAGFNPTDINKHNGFNTYIPHVRLINMVIHDQIGAGVYMSRESVGSEVHGCLSYNNGYTTTDIQDGHGFYFKNDGETLLFSDNFAFNGIASGFHAFTEGVDNFNNITLDGNVAFNAGVYSPLRGYRDLLVGGDGGQVVVDNISVKNSFLYYKPGSPASVLGMAQLGRDGTNGTLTLANNHFTAGVQLKNWRYGAVTGNRVAATGTLVDHYQNLANGSTMAWSGNVYQSLNNAATPYRVTKTSSQSLSFANWKAQTGFDASSTCVAGGCTGVEVYVRPNKYEPGRANLIVYNWAKQATVSVDVSGVLPAGTAYEVRNVQDFFAAPVLAGVYQGGALTLPMTGLTVSKPNGPFAAAAPIGPEFNAFVLVALPSGTPDAVAAVSGVPTTVAVTTLLANDSKLRAPLTLTAVVGVSSRGGSVGLASGQVTYKSAAGFTGGDTFTYTVVDNLGSVGTGLVTVTVAAGVVAPSLTWSKPAGLVYGQALTASQLNPTASAPGTFSFSPAAGAVLHAGLGRILTASFTPSDPTKYTSASIQTTIDVAPAPLTVAANAKTMTYGGVVPVLTLAYAGWVNGDGLSSLAQPASASTSASSASAVGAYVIAASGLAASDYAPVYQSGVLTVTPAALTISANPATMVAGTSLPAFSVTCQGWVNGDAALAAQPTCATTATCSSPAGTYAITTSGAAAPNYAITYQPGVLTVTPAPVAPTLVWNPPAGLVYGQPLTASQLNPASSAAGTFSFSPAAGTVLRAGVAQTLTASFTPADPAKFTPASIQTTIDVAPAPLTVTVDAKTMTYGEAVPALTLAYTGWVNGDGIGSLTNAAVASTTVTSASPVGTYPIVASGLAASDYTPDYQSGVLTVTPAALTISANPATMVAGTSLPAFSFTCQGWVNGDAALAAPPTCATPATCSSPAGTYAITPCGAIAPNYAITYQPGVLTVTPAPVAPTLVWNPPAGLVYGQPLTASQLNPTSSAAGTFSFSPAAGTVLHAGMAQTLTASFTPVDPAKFTAASIQTTIGVAPAPLTVAVDAKTMTYGGAVPALTLAYTGWVNGDGIGSLTNAAVAATTVTSASPVGTYPIVASGLVASDYAPDYQSGVLTVIPAALTISANPATMVAGTSLPAFSFTCQGWVNGDAALAAPPTCATTATCSSPAGTYAINPCGAAAPNYAITYQPGVLTVTPAPVAPTLVWNPPAGLVYGQPLTASQLNPASSAPGTFSFSPAAGTVLHAGMAQTLTASFTPVDPAKFTAASIQTTIGVAPAPLTVAVDAKTMTYGGAVPALTLAYTGWVNGDGIGSLTNAAVAATTVTSASPVGTYPIVASGLVASDYAPDYQSGVLTVIPAALTISANPATMVAGTSLPAFSFTCQGWVNGDAALAAPPTCATTATCSSPAGTYAINPCGAAAPNYAITYQPGVLTVTPAPVAPTLVWNPPAGLVYGQPLTASQLNPASSAPGTFSFSPAAGTVLHAGVAQTLTASFTPSDLTKFTPASIQTTIRVAPAPLTVAVAAKTMTYGGAVPALTLAYSGWVNGDGLSSLTQPASASTTVTSASAVGTYPIVASGLVASDYTPVYQNGVLTVNRTALTVTANPATMVAGASLPLFSATYQGWVNGDTVAAFTTPVQFSTPVTASSPAGSYVLSVLGGVAPNYTLAYQPGVLTVTAAPLPVGARSFTNSAAVTIPVQGPASAYPMAVSVSGMGGQVSKVTVKIAGFTHACVSDVTAVLVSPEGRAVELFSLVGAHADPTALTWVFDDAAAARLAASGNLTSGTYKPSVIGAVTTVPAPAPASGMQTNLSAFVGASPNGTWSLYVADRYPNDSGTISGGWVLNVTTATAAGSASAPAQLISFRSAPTSASAGIGAQGLSTLARLAANPDRSVDLRFAPGSSLEMSANGFDWQPVATGGASVWTDGTAALAMSRLYRVTAPGQAPVITGFARHQVPASGFAVLASPFGALDCAQAFADAPEGTQVQVFDPASSTFTVYTWQQRQWTSAAGGAPVVSPGTACFVKNPTAQGFEVVLSGVAPVTPPPVTYAAGYKLVAAVSPQAGLVESQLGLAVGPGDRIHVFTEGSYLTYRRTASRWLPAEPTISLGEGFFLETRRSASWSSNVAE